ncbi:MAG: UDP-N-acetylglucosamine 2-epimerase (non-hydrolyzing) [Gammaproteobacteria bacterium]|nr:UDP-N-acetylglucosamine 2-epimerase (non-hydrolyzing) [Gammaproteobacteria bacterium]
MTTKCIVTVVGARPQFVKAAPVSKAFLDDGRVREILLHTGQHHDALMSAIFFEELGIPAPAHHLEISGGTHGEMTGRMLPVIERVLRDEQPDAVLVYGDTNSTLAGALAAAKLNIPIGHVEAGLRSFNRAMPEEVNRIVTDHLSALLLAPTTEAMTNLQREGLGELSVHVGDVMLDVALAAAAIAERRASFLETQQLTAGEFVLVTLHRAENTDDHARLALLVDYIREQAAGRRIVLPIHPRTARSMEQARIPLHGFDVIEPLGYLDMVQAVRAAASVFTDSGGLQKECYFHRTPCVTLREETEWVETIEAGWNRLWHTPTYRPRMTIEEYGDGHAAEAIVECLVQLIAAADVR